MEKIYTQLRRSVEEASGKRTNSGRDGEKILSIHERIDAEACSAFDYAKDNRMWINDLYDLGKPFINGNENTNVLNVAEGAVYKSNNLMNSKTISNLIKSLQIHNKLFPETKYELVGFTGIDKGVGKVPYVEVLLKQSFIDIAIPANPSEIAEFMHLLGFNKLSDSSFSNGQFTVSDLFPRNVLKDNNGNLYVVDDIVTDDKLD